MEREEDEYEEDFMQDDDIPTDDDDGIISDNYENFAEDPMVLRQKREASSRAMAKDASESPMSLPEDKDNSGDDNIISMEHSDDI